MARATTRSQRQPSGSQSPRGTQQPSRSQRPRASQIEEEDEDEDAMDEDDNEESRGDGEFARKAHDLVRLALFTEQKRVPLRRDDISKKVLGSKSRAFGEVFTRAQEILRNTFGMEMVELRQRVEEDPNEKEKEAMNIKKKAPQTGTKTFILRSVLDPFLIEQATIPDKDILKSEQEEGFGFGDEDDEDSQAASRATGSLFAWQSSDQVGNIGILYVILALILVNGRSMTDADLCSLLKRLRLPMTAPLRTTSQSTHQHLTTESYLTQLIRQGYLDKIDTSKINVGGTKKRVRAPTATQAHKQEDNANYEWRWGPRSMSEVGEVGIAKFVAEFMVQQNKELIPDGEDEEEGEGALDVEGYPRAKQQLEAMMKGVEKAAAGGKLLDITGK
ncbi:MAGE family-domain-containing protein [Abortiporus biennis]|nr:MAGE family-domain-containing protein [Abortiporus biennis]